jgi:hypothetical protein
VSTARWHSFMGNCDEERSHGLDEPMPGGEIMLGECVDDRDGESADQVECRDGAQLRQRQVATERGDHDAAVSVITMGEIRTRGGSGDRRPRSGSWT